MLVILPYDSSLAQSQIGLYTSELIHREGRWRGIDQIDIATAGWVQWCNTERTHRSIGYPALSSSSNSTTPPSKPSNERADSNKTLSRHAGATHRDIGES